MSATGSLAYIVFAAPPVGVGPTEHAALWVDDRQLTTDEDVFLAPAKWLSADELLYTSDGRIRIRNLTTGIRTDVPFHARVTLRRPGPQARQITVSGSQEVLGVVRPRVSPDGHSVAFVALNGLWVRGNSAKPQLVVRYQPAYSIQSPSWSPDGRRLFYSSDHEGLPAIYSYDIGTGAQSRVTPDGRSGFTDPALSPDGRLLSYQDETHAIRVLELQTGVERVVANPFAGRERAGASVWSPDSRYLAYNDRGTINTRFREGYNEIKVVDVATTAFTMYTVAPARSLSDRGDCGPAWSPDGRWMSFIMESALWVLPVDAQGKPTGDARLMTDEPADAPSWTGDSRTLVYISNGRLRSIPVGGGKPSDIPLSIRWRTAVPQHRTRIRTGRLWDGISDTVQLNTDILVDGDRIVAVEPRREPRGHEQLVDASQLTVLPGLWESHNHPTEEPAYGGRYFGIYLAYGITGNITMGSIAYDGAHQREALQSGDMAGPRHVMTGELFDGSRTSHPPTRAIATQDGLRRSLERARALKFEYIKTYVRTSPTVMAQAAAFGHDKLGVPSGTHLLAQAFWEGLDMITHLRATERLEYSNSRSDTGHSYQDVRTLLTDGQVDVTVTPFEAVYLIGADPALAADPGTNPDAAMGQRQISAIAPPTPPQLAAVTLELGTCTGILRAGGRVLAGSDSPLTFPGITLHMALRGMVTAGMTPFEALRTATVIPTTVMGISNDVGTIQRGKLADLTFVQGDPLTNINDLINTPQTMKNGILTTQEQLIAPFRK